MPGQFRCLTDEFEDDGGARQVPDDQPAHAFRSKDAALCRLKPHWIYSAWAFVDAGRAQTSQQGILIGMIRGPADQRNGEAEVLAVPSTGRLRPTLGWLWSGPACERQERGWTEI